ncbi:MerR family transcriptional regulator [Paenibacillus terrae]|uniref:MerR family transcriptional regulator n=1 Tax=Paenibacillus terrae TaxID=159743 RepID=UPI0011EB503A|nr:MerR family transcriptional regulator [Paenibacillus terrae]
MNIQKLTIGQMAELNHITRQTLRHYEAEGLLTPYYTDPNSGYRYYHINQSARLDMIHRFKICGMSLKQIKQEFETANIEDIQSSLKTQLDFIDESVRRLNQSRYMISRTLNNYARYKSLPQGPTIFHEHLPPRKIYVHTSSVNFFDQEDSGYEIMLSELKTSLVEKKLPASYLCNIGTIIRRPYIEERMLYSNEVFVFVEDDFEIPAKVEILPGGMYVNICSETIFKESEYAEQLLNYITDAGFIIAGDYICEVIAEFPMFDNLSRSMLYKIQIPVTTKEG